MVDVSKDFEETGAPVPRAELVVDVGGFAGPIDLLLTLARDQKVDLTRISILELADQYLAWVAAVSRTNLELAADYLVVAAWLAYLKSRLLLPAAEGEDEPSGEEMAAALAFQLRRLEGMQEAGSHLMARGRLGQDFFGRGEPESFAGEYKTVLEVTLFDLLKAYGDQMRRGKSTPYEIEPSELLSQDEALQNLVGMLGRMPDWTSLMQFLPAGIQGDLFGRSATASTLAAALQLSKDGQVHLRQSERYGPIYIRATGNKIETKE